MPSPRGTQSPVVVLRQRGYNSLGATLLDVLSDYVFSYWSNHLPRPFKIKPTYIHLTTHSAFSLQEGLSTPTDLVQVAQVNGMPAMGITHHNLLTGMIEFVTACKAAEIQPIIGLEVDLNDGPVSLFATSLEGWSCLCRLSSSINLRDNPDTPCSLDMLSSCSQDLIAISNQPQLLKEVFPDRLYVNIQGPNDAENVSNLGRQLKLPTVITHPIYYLAPEQASLQRTLKLDKSH